jgi:MYXO-CTERM domain-containing protein
VTTYLAAGGTLLASGTEIGWDLEARAGGVTFLHDVLGVTYVRDDAGTRTLRGKAGTPFAALGATLLSDGSASYPADSCDVFSPRAGYQDVLGYETTGAPSAGIGKAARSLVLGFPIEAVTDAARRAELVTTSVEFLAPALRVVTGGGVAPIGSGGTSPINSGSIPIGGGGVAPIGSGAKPAVTAAPTRSKSGGGGGCSLSASPSSDEAPAAPAALALGLAALVLVRRRRVD